MTTHCTVQFVFIARRLFIQNIKGSGNDIMFLFSNCDYKTIYHNILVHHNIRV